MKKSIILRTLFSVVLLMTSVDLFATGYGNAYDFEEDGIYFRVSGSKKVCVSAYNVYYRTEHLYKGDVVIPSTIQHKNKTYSVVGIDDNAFRDCEELTSVTIPDGVERIGNRAFDGCRSLTAIVLPNTVKTISKRALANCPLLATVSIGAGIEEIGEEAFYKSYCLETLYVRASQMPKIDEDAFEALDLKSATLYVPNGTEKSYRRIEPWCKFGNVLPQE